MYNIYEVIIMSDRERAIDIINQIPEYKMIYVVEMLNGLKGLMDNITEEVEPDEWDLKMLEEAEKINDNSAISLNDLAKDLSLNV